MGTLLLTVLGFGTALFVLYIACKDCGKAHLLY